MWSFARAEFGMQRAEFFAMNLRQWDALRKRREDAWSRSDQMAEFMGAQIVAMVRRCGFVQWKEPMSAEDFMPSRHKAREEEEARKTPEERVAAGWAKYNAGREVYLKNSKLAGRFDVVEGPKT